MKKLLKTLALAAALSIGLAACSNTDTPTTTGTPESNAPSVQTSDTASDDALGTPKGDKFKVGIVQFVENGAFDDMREGFIERLRELGYTEDRLDIVYENAQADASTMNTIVRGMNDGSFDLVTTIATPPSQAFVNLGSSTPNVFIAMSDPIGAGVLSSFDAPDKNSTGTSNPIPIEGIFAIADDLTPDAKHFGLLYSTNEVNSLNTINQAKAFMDEHSHTYQDGTVSNSSEVQQVVEAMLPEVDAIFIPNDSIIQNAMPIVVDAAIKAGVPIYGSSAVMVEAGALASVAVSDTEIGAESANLAAQILQGADPSTVPAIAVEGRVLDLNKATADALGITIPEEIMGNAVVHE